MSAHDAPTPPPRWLARGGTFDDSRHLIQHRQSGGSHERAPSRGPPVVASRRGPPVPAGDDRRRRLPARPRARRRGVRAAAASHHHGRRPAGVPGPRRRVRRRRRRRDRARAPGASTPTTSSDRRPPQRDRELAGEEQTRGEAGGDRASPPRPVRRGPISTPTTLGPRVPELRIHVGTGWAILTEFGADPGDGCARAPRDDGVGRPHDRRAVRPTRALRSTRSATVEEWEQVAAGAAGGSAPEPSSIVSVVVLVSDTSRRAAGGKDGATTPPISSCGCRPTGCAPNVPTEGRVGGAGPSDVSMLWVDDYAVTLDTDPGRIASSPFELRGDGDGALAIYEDGRRVAPARVAAAAPLLRPRHGRRHPVLEDRPAAPRLAGEHRAPDVRLLGQRRPVRVLRHRRVVCEPDARRRRRRPPSWPRWPWPLATSTAPST